MLEVTRAPLPKDPPFTEELEQKIKAALPPVPPLPKLLPKKRVLSYLQPGLVRSLIVHGSLLLLTVLIHLPLWLGFGPSAEEKMKALSPQSAIRVDIVDLPREKLAELSKIDLTQEVGSDEDEELLPKQSPTAMIDKTKNVSEPVKKASEKIPNKLKELRERLRADLRRKELVARLKSKVKEGRKIVAGNIVSEGYSLSGDVATEAGAFTGKLQAHMKKCWEVPAWIDTRKLRALVLMKLAGDGRVLSLEFTKRSGNPEFDRWVEKSIQRCSPFPRPPEELKRQYQEEGVPWAFPDNN